MQGLISTCTNGHECSSASVKICPKSYIVPRPLEPNPRGSCSCLSNLVLISVAWSVAIATAASARVRNRHFGHGSAGCHVLRDFNLVLRQRTEVQMTQVLCILGIRGPAGVAVVHAPVSGQGSPILVTLISPAHGVSSWMPVACGARQQLHISLQGDRYPMQSL